jgi:hypothetical protein
LLVFLKGSITKIFLFVNFKVIDYIHSFFRGLWKWAEVKVESICNFCQFALISSDTKKKMGGKFFPTAVAHFFGSHLKSNNFISKWERSFLEPILRPPHLQLQHVVLQLVQLQLQQWHGACVVGRCFTKWVEEHYVFCKKTHFGFLLCCKFLQRWRCN